MHGIRAESTSKAGLSASSVAGNGVYGASTSSHGVVTDAKLSVKVKGVFKGKYKRFEFPAREDGGNPIGVREVSVTGQATDLRPKAVVTVVSGDGKFEEEDGAVFTETLDEEDEFTATIEVSDDAAPPNRGEHTLRAVIRGDPPE